MPNFRPLSETKFINDANLVSYWKLDGNSNDSKGANNGTDSNVSYVAGQFSNCASFNGSSSVINVGNTGLNLTGDFTIAGWMYITSSSNPILNILTTRGQSGSPYEQYAVFEQNGTIYCRLRNTAGNTVYDASAPSSGINTWQFVVGVVSGTTVSIYVNAKKGTDATFTGTRLNLSIDTKIGGGYVSNQPFWMNGRLDDVAIFSRALSASEVNELYQGMTLGEYLGAGSGTTKLLLHLNGNSTDSSGNGNNGTDTNITYSQANGKFGQGAGFNGGSSKIINTTQIGNVNDEKTISLWAYNNEVMSGANKYTIIFELAFGTQYAGYQFLFDRENNVNRVRAVRDRGCVGGEDIVLDIGSNQKWFHLVLTLIGTTMSFYVDKKLIGSVTINTGNGSCNNQLGYYIGCGRANSMFSNVKVEEVIVENRGWTQSYIDKYYTNAKGRFGII